LGGLTLFGAIGSNLDAYVRALSSTGRFKIVARPSVYTTNNKLALIASGQQVPVPENSLSGYTGSSSTLASSTNIGYKDVVLSLQVIPRVSANHQINLQIQQQNDSIGTSVSIAGNSVPTVNTQLINTEVTVKNRDTVVIGGLISESQTNNTSGVPVLQDIPLLGNLFKDKTKSKTRSELVVLIQPTVIENDDQAGVTSAYEIRRSSVGPDSAQRLDDVPVAPLAPADTVKPNP
jgi:type II secretory pathway component GspD/PulD (secretin)